MLNEQGTLGNEYHARKFPFAAYLEIFEFYLF